MCLSREQFTFPVYKELLPPRNCEKEDHIREQPQVLGIVIRIFRIWEPD